MNTRTSLWAGLILLAMWRCAPATTVAYDAASGVLPQDPPFTRFDFDFPIVGPTFGHNAPQSVAGGIYEMGPSDQGRYTFWFTNDLVLDHTQVVEISARLKLLSQSSVNPTDRSGLAIALTDDRNFYNEFYVAENEVFLNRRDGTTRVRDTAFAMNATGDFHDYTMRVQGDAITILIDGVERLTGSMFDTAGLAGVPTLPNWASLGDITSSAAGSWQMQTFSVSVIPEPAGLGLLLVAGGLMRRGRWGRS